MNSADLLTRMIRAGAGAVPADLVIRNVRLLDIITGAITETDIAIVADRIVGTHARYRGDREIDGRRRLAVPGFIDAHMHIETSHVTPFEFDRGVLPYGVTTVFCDPHEVANVLGAEGIRYFLDCAEQTVMDVRVNLSSCVPSTPFETSGARLEVEDLMPFRSHPKAFGLAEVMNFPGVVAADPGMLAKLDAFSDGHIDGHAPLLSGERLNGYLAARIRTDHETTSAVEAREKLAKGMAILIREGSASKDLNALAEILDENTASFVALCTDDRNPLDIAEEGHLDSSIRRLIAKGCRPHHVYRAASHSAARIFGLRDRGFVAPGWRADIVLLDNLEECRVSDVFSAGRLVTPELFGARRPVKPVGLNSMKATPVNADTFRIAPKPGRNSTPVIVVKPGLLISFREDVALPSGGGALQPDITADILKTAVIERHGRNGNIGKGFVKGMGLKRGAIASSIGHDSHNITVVGTSDAEMTAAVNRVVEMGGGMVAVDRGKVVAELALPLAGLMSLEPFETVAHSMHQLRDAARAIGCTVPEPFLQMAFLALPVIPHLKLTDQGLFDVDKFGFVD